MSKSRKSANQDKLNSTDSGLSRRSFLQYIGIGATVAGAALGPLSARSESAAAVPTADDAWLSADGVPNFTPTAYPLPLPGDKRPTNQDSQNFAEFEVRDELSLPEGFEYAIIAKWGDSFGPQDQPAKRIDFGTNCDYTGLVPVPGKQGEFFLIVNHEDVSSRTWLQGFAAVKGRELPKLAMAFSKEFPKGQLLVDGKELPGGMFSVEPSGELPLFPPEFLAQMKQICLEGLRDMGISILHVRRAADGHFKVIADSPRHRRIHSIGGQNIEAGALFELTGPARHQAGSKCMGTFSNCSGGTTPWGTFLTCEENIQNHLIHEVDPAGRELAIRPRFLGATSDYEPKSLHKVVQEPHYLNGLFHAAPEKVNPVTYGWICEINPQTGGMRKHSALGRFRHENAAIRSEKGKPLAIYMGDDRRGGHVWKYVSEGVVENPADPANSRLFEKGTLFVAHFEADNSGTWIPITPKTKLVKPDPQFTSLGHIWLPARPTGGEVGVGDSESASYAEISLSLWVEAIERFAGKPFDSCTLGDLTRPSLSASDPNFEDAQLGIILSDAFLMANAAGGTPSCRPEDLEVHPHDKSVYIAFTDATGKKEGAPDRRIFPDSDFKTSRQYGGIYRLEEQGNEPGATRFKWGRFVPSGEVAERGGGFACADNLVFDPRAHLWMVTDISTSALNFAVTRGSADDSGPGQPNFAGVFGNNAMFCIPTSGPLAGVPHCFATGPMEAELTGPTFTEDGKTLILSVQHPGELSGMRKAGAPLEPREYKIVGRDNKLFTQKRNVPVGSNFPENKPGSFPRSIVVSIIKKKT